MELEFQIESDIYNLQETISKVMKINNMKPLQWRTHKLS